MVKKKRIAAIFVLSFSISMHSPVFASTELITGQLSEAPLNEISKHRLYGGTRYETAKVISEYYRLCLENISRESSGRGSENSTNNGSEIKLPKVKNVVIATGSGYADALSASVLAQELKAPIVLVDSKIETSPDAFAYINENLDPEGKIYIIGGEGIIGSEFEQKFLELGFSNVIRIAGADRYETSYNIANTLKDSTFSTVVISSGEQYSDALSISSFAANQGWPILLAPSYELPPKIKDFLLDKVPQQVYITGGTGAISDQVLGEIRVLIPQASVERLTGQSRFDTNIVIARTFAPKPGTVYLTTGHNYADALAGSVVAAQTGDPIVYVDPSLPTLPKATARYLEDLALSEAKPKLVVFGGSGAVSDDILNNAADLISGTVKASDIHSVPDLKDTVEKGKAYSLPTTVRARLYNSDWTNLFVQWNTEDIDTKNIGEKVLEGIVVGSDKTVKLNLTITEPGPKAEYATQFNAGDLNRTENLRLAAKAIDGKRIAPGEIFSFNETVGKRTIEAGYKEAMVISGDMFVPGVGGGVCQVSSTLYNAVNLAKLEIVERHHHSLPVAYVPPGQDATVYYGLLDFKFRNDTEEYLQIKASIEGGTLTIKIY